MKKTAQRRSVGRGAPGQPRQRKEGLPPPVGAYTLDGFCAAHGFGLNAFYEMEALNLAPATFYVGSRRRFVSVEEASRWRAERTANAEADLALWRERYDRKPPPPPPAVKA